MHVDMMWSAILALALPALAQCGPLFILTAPNLLRVGSWENVFVEAQEYTGESFNVEIQVKDFPTKSREIFSKTVSLNATNSFQVLQGIFISADFFEGTHGKRFVYLEAKFPQQKLEKLILVSFLAGYIFVQTDKTIYTPEDTVHYRIYALNPGLEPVASGVSLAVMSPEGITVQKDVVHPENGIKSGQYKLPGVASVGTWKLVSRFHNTPERNFTSDFEVKKYVLPSFGIKLTPGKPFFYIDDVELTVDITARYLYGEDVSGKAFVVFGVLTEDGEKKSIPASLQRVNVISGKGNATLKREQIQKTFPDISQLIRLSLYVSVSVLTVSGSEMVEAERQGIQIVTSPYTIHFKKTASYFKPGIPFDVMIYITNPDDTPAKDIDVEVTPGPVLGRTTENGIAKVTVNTEVQDDSLSITVKTKDPYLTEEQQTVQRMVALPYRTQQGSNNYLHISMQTAELKIGDNLGISLNLVNSPGVQEQINHITYLVLNKGRLIHAKRFERLSGQSLVILSLPVTKDMVPSFRFLAYYHVGTEVVSDSVWVDVKATCMGTLEVTSTKLKDVYEPRKPFSLTITGDPGAKVGLVAVDKGVYVLNNKNRLTQTKIWEFTENQDTGCTPGSGADSMAVFYDAGLAFESSAGGTKYRTDPNCPARSKSRQRRSLTLIDLENSLVGEYTGLERQCCVDGIEDNLQGYTCERRSRYIIDGLECVSAFLHCCKEVKKKHPDYRQEALLLAHSEDKQDEYISDFDINSRTQFPESWLWGVETLPPCPVEMRECQSTSVVTNGYLKDSITTWEVTAISLSKYHGICVADPFEMKVMKSFFIDLKMPYATVRNEQVEVKAVLHNYLDEEIKVQVDLMETPEVCSAASKKRTYRMPEVFMDPMSSHAIPFVIIPMALGLHSIEVKAAVSGSFYTDGVKKDLRVVAEGVKIKKEVITMLLNPLAYDGVQSQKINAVKLSSRVPGSPAYTYISVTGELPSQPIQEAISGSSMGRLIARPTGNGEQNMISMTGPVISTHYMDTTHQWEKVGLERRALAIKYITMGYTQQMYYRKTDGSYSVWKDRKPSTWLTAYVAKVFGLAYRLVTIADDVLCSALKWLVLNAQQPDGIFKEHSPVYDAEIMGGVQGKDSDASMTAFVLIAMQESRHICAMMNLSNSMEEASDFLSRRIHSLTNPYAVALTAYALSNEGNHQLDILNRFSSEKTHWPVPGSHLSTLEATGYALLALVKAKEFNQAQHVIRWLTKHKFHNRGPRSTQATMIVFQAVAMYMSEVSDLKNIDLQVSLSVVGRSQPVRWTFNWDNAHLTRSERINFEENLTVTAKGTGQGTLSVMTIYNALPEEKEPECGNFELEVKIEREPHVTNGDALETYKLTIEMIYKSFYRDATMSVLDITMLTGFIADEKDLDRLTSGRDRYVQKIEIDKQLSQKGSLVFFLDKVSHQLSDIVAFRIHKMNRVGLLQPAAVTLYEYNSMENRCTKFYHPKKKDGTLNTICHENVCRCAEENCSYQKKKKVDELDREAAACEAGMDYVYKAKVLQADLTPTMDRFTVLVQDVIKEGTDSGVRGENRTFVAHPQCREAIDLTEGKTYLIMGKSVDLIRGEDRMMYMLGRGTWIEHCPMEVECLEPVHRCQE
ncbi:complement C3-like [Anguilla rostrata]|uniref:complement C3-like n=1 Tax=Anguilla rostrata TaxID=7938 RepID=UPI0030D1D7EA